MKVMKILRVTTVKEIFTLLDYVHDCEYDLDRVVLDRKLRELLIPISLGKMAKEGMLRIKGVFDAIILDEAEIGIGDINTINYEGDDLIIRGGFPVNIHVKVSQLEIELLLPSLHQQ